MSINDNVKNNPEQTASPYANFQTDPNIQVPNAPFQQQSEQPQQGAGAPETNAQYINPQQQQMNTQGYTQQPAPDIFLQLMSLAPTIQLSPEGQDYYKKLTDIILSDQFLSRPIKIIPLTVPQKGIFIFYPSATNPLSDKEGVGIVVLFEETLKTAVDNSIYDYENNNPIYKAIPESRTAINAAIQDIMQKQFNIYESKVYILSVQIVRPQDYKYDRVIKLADYIRNTFRLNDMCLNGNSLNSPFKYQQIFPNSTLDVSTNYDQITDFSNLVSPHAVQPRRDFGCRVSIKYSDSHAPFNAKVKNYLDLGIIGGYTQFIAANNNGYNYYSNPAYANMPYGMSNPVLDDNPRFTPLIHITDIATVYPTPAILPILMSFFFKIFLINKQFQVPHLDITDKNDRRNISYLFPPDANTNEILSELNSPEGRIRLLNSRYFSVPVLVLDVSEGSFPLTGFNNTEITSLNNYIRNIICNAFGVYVTNDIFEAQWEEYTGIVNDGINIIDSRYFSDYLTIMSIHHDIGKAAPSLNIADTPINKKNYLENLYSGYGLTIQSVTTMYKISLAWLMEMYSILNKFVIIDEHNSNFGPGIATVNVNPDINYQQVFNQACSVYSIPLNQSRHTFGGGSPINYYSHVAPPQQRQFTPGFQSKI
jgi:hypothetical protein